MRLALLCGSLLAAAVAHGQAAPDTLRPPADSLRTYGWTVDADDEWLLVGADEIPPAGGLSSDPKGTVFVYRLGTGVPTLAGRLTSDRLGREDCFSWSMDIRSNVAIVGARCEYADGQSGAAYVYRYDGTGWVREAKLRGSNLVGVEGPVYGFGQSVAIGEGYLVVGAPLTPNPDNPTDDFGSGAAFVFERQGGAWIHTATLVNSDTGEQRNETFGASVAVIDDSTPAVVIGAYQGLGPGATSRRGAVYVYERQGVQWTERTRLLEPSESQNTSFGGYLGSGRGAVAIFSRESIYPLDHSAGGWHVGEALTPPSFLPHDVARWGSTVVAVGGTVGQFPDFRYPIQVYTEEEGTWRTRAEFTLDYLQSVTVSVNSRDLFVGRAYGSFTSEPDYVLVQRLASLTDAAPPPPAAHGLDVMVIPNPSFGAAHVRFETDGAGPARLMVVDALGRRVTERTFAVLGAGPHEILIDLGHVARGVYVVHIEAAGKTATSVLVRR